MFNAKYVPWGPHQIFQQRNKSCVHGFADNLWFYADGRPQGKSAAIEEKFGNLQSLKCVAGVSSLFMDDV